MTELGGTYTVPRPISPIIPQKLGASEVGRIPPLFSALLLSCVEFGQGLRFPASMVEDIG